MCGDTTAQKDNVSATAANLTAAQQQASSIYGSDTTAFDDLMKTYAPTVAAGPSQNGYSAQTLSNLNSSAITQTGIEAKNEKAALGNAESTQVGSNGSGPVGPGGATVGANLSLAENAGNQTASELSQIQTNDVALGNQNYNNAVTGLTNAPNVFQSGSNATNAATNSANAADTSANNAAQAANSPWQALAGAAGNVAGMAAGAAIKGCWIAAEIYGGWYEPRTVLVREYLNADFRTTLFGSMIMKIYLRFGQRIAAIAKRSKTVKTMLTPLFNMALTRAQSAQKGQK